MKRNIYNLVLKGSATGDDVLGTPGGDTIGTPGGDTIGIPGGSTGEALDITPTSYKFYNVQLDRVLYYITCSNGDQLQCPTGNDLRAYNVE